MLFSIPVANMKLAMVQSPRPAAQRPWSAGKGKFGNAPNARRRDKQTPRLRLIGEVALVEADAGRADVQLVEVRPAERAAGRLRYGHVELGDARAGRGITPHAPAVPEGDPQATLGIRRHPVGIAVALAISGEDA